MNRYRSRVRDWLGKRRPDVLTLQKIGLDEEFYEEEFLKVGYRSTYVGGQIRSQFACRRYHTEPPRSAAAESVRPRAEGREARIIRIPDRGHRRPVGLFGLFPYCEKGRVAWLNRLRDHVRDEAYHRRDSVLCGDFNVKFKADGPRGSGYTHKHEDALKELMSLGFSDLYRATYPDPTKHPAARAITPETTPKSLPGCIWLSRARA